MARLSTVRRLPAAVRQYIAASREAGATIDELVDAIEAEFGAAVSRSAMGRHVKTIDQVAARMRESREMAEVLVRELGDIADDRQGELLVQMLHTMVFKQFRDRLSGDGEDFDPKEFMMLGRALKDAKTASAIGTRQAADIRREERQQALEQAAKAVETAMNEKKEISQAEILARIRAAYGVPE